MLSHAGGQNSRSLLALLKAADARLPLQPPKARRTAILVLFIEKVTGNAEPLSTGFSIGGVCRTCLESLEAPINLNSYCARHHHELDALICDQRNTLIGGSYLEKELKQMFHSHCFSCQECHKSLSIDYFEWNGRILCEDDAFEAA